MGTATLQLSFLTILLCTPLLASAAWKPAQGPLQTRWTGKVSPRHALPEYPRPQMARQDWLNLNGLWDFAVTAKDALPPCWEGQLLQ